jgi:hypothetical protein
MTDDLHDRVARASKEKKNFFPPFFPLRMFYYPSTFKSSSQDQVGVSRLGDIETDVAGSLWPVGNLIIDCRGHQTIHLAIAMLFRLLAEAMKLAAMWLD